jgi:hypothetical protein
VRHSRGLFVRTSWAFGSLNEARLANPRPVLQREVNSAGGIDLFATFPALLSLRLDHQDLTAPLNHEGLSRDINGLSDLHPRRSGRLGAGPPCTDRPIAPKFGWVENIEKLAAELKIDPLGEIELVMWGEIDLPRTHLRGWAITKFDLGQ